MQQSQGADLTRASGFLDCGMVPHVCLIKDPVGFAGNPEGGILDELRCNLRVESIEESLHLKELVDAAHHHSKFCCLHVQT